MQTKIAYYEEWVRTLEARERPVDPEMLDLLGHLREWRDDIARRMHAEGQEP